MPQGEIPQNFRSNQPFLLPRILAIKKRGETFLPESSFLISTAKDWSCEGVFSIKLRSVISKTQFFDWGACKLMKPCEKRNCCLAQNYFSYQAISECWYFMDPCHTCHAEFGWKAAALKGPGSSTRFDLHEKHVVGLYPPSGRMRMHCCGAFQTWRTTCLVGRLIPNLDDNECGVPLGKKCWNIEYTKHHVIFENEYIISIWDRSASHMVPYVISVVAKSRPMNLLKTPKQNTYLAY